MRRNRQRGTKTQASVGVDIHDIVAIMYVRCVPTSNRRPKLIYNASQTNPYPVQTITVQPAYGREYNSQAAVLEDWHSGKDFRIVGTSTYVDKKSAIQYGIREVRFRFKKNTQLTSWKGDSE